MTVAVENSIPFPAATGKGVKIAVIDSGVNISHPHILGSSTTGVLLSSDEPGTSWEDQIGHGTAVTAAVQERAPGAEYYAVKLFGPSLRATARRLLEAIEWSIDSKMDLINLSLGTTNFEYEIALKMLATKAEKTGCLIVSARKSGELPALPGALPNVIGVDVDWNLSRDRYLAEEENGRPVFAASGYPRALPGVPQSRNLHGISFAVANMTGFVARAIEQSQTKSFEEITRVLAAEAARCYNLENHA